MVISTLAPLINFSVRYFMDDDTGEALVIPDTMRISRVSSRNLTSKVLFSADVEFYVADATLKKFSKARRIAFDDVPRAEFVSSSTHVFGLNWMPNDLAWSYSISFQVPADYAGSAVVALRTDISFLGPKISGSTEPFQRSLRVAWYQISQPDFDAIDLGGVSLPIRSLATRIAQKCDSQYVDALVDAFLKSVEVGLEESATGVRLKIGDRSVPDVSLYIKQEVREVISIDHGQLAIEDA